MIVASDSIRENVLVGFRTTGGKTKFWNDAAEGMLVVGDRVAADLLQTIPSIS
jgi:hypothetical protein